MSRFFFICLTITGAKKIVRYIAEFVVWRFVRYRGSYVLGRSRALATGLSFCPVEKV